MTRQYNKTIPDDWKFITKGSRPGRTTTNLQRIKAMKQLETYKHYPLTLLTTETERQQLQAIITRIEAGGTCDR